VKVLSGRQPWWWAILHAGKAVENRVWSTKYRGPILLHAALGCTRLEYADAVSWMVSRGLARSPLCSLDTMSEIALRVAGVDPMTLPLIPPLADMQRGGIVGRARIVDVLSPSTDGKPRAPWHMRDQHGFVLADVELLPFGPCRGMLGLFTAPADVLAQIGSST
jgi:hypothetical protein